MENERKCRSSVVIILVRFELYKLKHIFKFWFIDHEQSKMRNVGNSA